MTSWKSCALPMGLVTAFENFKRKPPVILRRFIQITWKDLSVSISTPAVHVSMKSLTDSRLSFEFGPWQLNTDCESPLEHRTGYWMRHIKSHSWETYDWVQCIQALLNTHGFGDVQLNPFIAGYFFTNSLKHVWTISSNRENFYSIENRHERFINMPYQQNNCTCLLVTNNWYHISANFRLYALAI